MRAIVCERFGGPEAVALRENWPEPEAAVSYTHLTLPTIYSV